MGKYIDLIGRTFGRLNVIDRIYNNEKNAYWLCKCECSNIIRTSTTHLKSGHTLSCGCLRSEASSEILKIHGKSNIRIYKIWSGIKKRCHNKNFEHYKHYGGKGIIVCDEWISEFESFYNWAIKSGYSDKLTIDRIDFNKNYEPNNCRWVDWKMQQNNKSTNKYLEYKGKKQTYSQWANELNIPYSRLYGRIIRGVSIEKILKEAI